MKNIMREMFGEEVGNFFHSPIYVHKIILNCLHWKKVVKF